MAIVWTPLLWHNELFHTYSREKRNKFLFQSGFFEIVINSKAFLISVSFFSETVASTASEG